MQGVRHIQARQLIALLLMAVMVLVHATKILHHHTPAAAHTAKSTHTFEQAQAIEKACSICEFQLAQDAPFTGDIQLSIAPAFLSPVYTRLLTAINVDPILVIDGRGPPAFTA